jgi:quercetin dioxygenase-like cupin family protein
VQGTLVAVRKLSLDALAREQLEKARAGSGRAAETVFGGHEQALRQTVIALTAGNALQEHESPGEATLHVLTGRVRLTAAGEEWQGREGDLLLIPPARHALVADEDAVVLLTVVKNAS